MAGGFGAAPVGERPGGAHPAEAADGEEFDELFVEYMVFHHEGAIAMAEEVMREGEHPVVYTMAGDIAIEQSVEITRLQDIIDGDEDGEEEE